MLAKADESPRMENEMTANDRPAEPVYCSVAEFCQLSGLSTTTVYALLGDGSLTGVKVRSRTLIDRQAALTLLASNRWSPSVPVAPRRGARRKLETSFGASSPKTAAG
jgi:excisionase family DNA binding protein